MSDRRQLLLLAALLAPGAARADVTAVPDDAVDISAIKGKLKVVTDGKNHFIAVVPFDAMNGGLYYGDGKSFWQQRVGSGGSEGSKSFDATYWEPRVLERYRASFGFRDGKYTVQCDKRSTEVKPLPDGEARAMIDGAKFWKPRWKHRAYALARDDSGSYFYVDKIREPEESKSFRLFVGPKGRMKLQKMTNVVSDSEGDIFATKTGELRLVLGRGQSFWIHGKSKQKLTLVPVEDNATMIYTELGVYTGEPLGTPCDDL